MPSPDSQPIPKLIYLSFLPATLIILALSADFWLRWARCAEHTARRLLDVILWLAILWVGSLLKRR